MEKKKSYKKYFYGIFVPIMVMIVALSTAGISYAWFSNSVSAEISTIHLSTAEIFTLEFEISGDSGKYEGQKAVLGSEKTANNQFPIGTDGGHLVTAQYAKSVLGLEDGSNLYNIYMGDSAFGPYENAENEGARFNLRLDTDGKKVELDITLASVTVEKKDDSGNVVDALTIEIPKESGYDVSDIAYGFTWYLEAGGKTFTPYGEKSALGNKALSDFATTSNISLSATSANLESGQTNATFTVVFAPEKLYWMQYGTDWEMCVKDVYPDYSTDAAFKEKWDDINKYSAIAYAGATFKFDIQIEVVSISEA